MAPSASLSHTLLLQRSVLVQGWMGGAHTSIRFLCTRRTVGRHLVGSFTFIYGASLALPPSQSAALQICVCRDG